MRVLGIIAGRGDLPIIMARNALEKYNQVVIACIHGEANSSDYQQYKHSTFKLGQVGSIIEFFHEYNVKDVVIAGAVNKPSFNNIAVDADGAKLLSKILKNKVFGDDSVLTVAADFLESKGFKVISSQDIANLTASSGVLTVAQPSDTDVLDIKLGRKVLETLGNMDIGQSVIIENGVVLGIEAAEGTDALIQRCGLLRKNTVNSSNADNCDTKAYSGVLVKMPKTSQNMKLDLPTVGTETILNLSKAGFKGLAIESKTVLIIDKEKVVESANQHNIFIKVI